MTSVLKNLDAAVSAAEEYGPNQYAVFDSKLHEQVLRRQAIARYLQTALEKNEIEVRYRPIAEDSGQIQAVGYYALEDAGRLIARLMEEGKVLHWGMSEVSIRTIRKAHTMLPLTAIQNEYSIWYRDVETELLSVLEELGIGLVCFCPLGRGYLTGNLKQSNFTSKDVRIGMPRFSSEAALKANQGLLTLLQQQAEKKGCTMAQLALAWILSRRPWIVPIPGTTKLSRLEENIGAANVEFEPQELDELNSKLDQIQIYGERYNAQQESLVER